MACEPVAGRVQFGPADVGGAVQDLPLQIAEIDDVEIDEAEPADAGCGEVEAQRRAEAAGADEQHAGRFEPLLAVDADLRHDQVPAVAGDFAGEENEVASARAARESRGEVMGANP